VKLIVGLGNPGLQYERTRHNVGFMTVDRLADRHARAAIPRGRFNAVTIEASLPGPGGQEEKCLLVKPTTYMNRSGLAVADVVRFYKVDPVADILILVDDLYLPCGTIRLRDSGSAAGHNGLADIQRCLGSDRYARCRIGIDPPVQIPQADYVLGRFTDDQWPLVDTAISKAADAAELFVRSGMTAAMNKFNGKTEDPPARKPASGPPPSSTDPLSS